MEAHELPALITAKTEKKLLINALPPVPLSIDRGTGGVCGDETGNAED